jgi:hypothetical protein
MGTKGFRETVSPANRYGQGSWDTRRLTGDELREIEADKFAAALLMPVGLVKRARSKYGNDEQLASLFGVSLPVMTQRLKELSLSSSSSLSQNSDGQALLKSVDGIRTQPEEADHQVNSSAVHRAAFDKVVPPQNAARINTILASNNYSQKTGPASGNNKGSRSSAGSPTPSAPAMPDLSRIRELARKIDSSVK